MSPAFEAFARPEVSVRAVAAAATHRPTVLTYKDPLSLYAASAFARLALTTHSLFLSILPVRRPSLV
jgi:hypothetical protein